MQGWMIAFIVIAGVVLALATAFLIGALVAVKKILGRRTTPSGESPEKYGVDIGWFDALAELTETVEIKSYDGLTLRALLLRQPDNGTHAKVAVCQHGYGATPRSMQPQAKIFYERGYNVLLPAARAHANSEGKYIGMAWLDRFDLLRWIDKAVSIFGATASIALAGTSMGGATVIAAAGMSLPPQVKCVVDDCGFSSQREEYAANIERVKLPVSLKLLPLAVGVRLVFGYSISDADIVPLAKAMRVPALFIHGEKDTYVPFALGKKLYEACGSADKQFYAVAEASHAMAYAAEPEKYTETFGAFIDKYVK